MKRWFGKGSIEGLDGAKLASLTLGGQNHHRRREIEHKSCSFLFKILGNQKNDQSTSRTKEASPAWLTAASPKISIRDRKIREEKLRKGKNCKFWLK